MSLGTIKYIAVSFVPLWSVAFLHAQPDFDRTKVVDPTATDFATHNDIQAAIDAIGEPGANDHWTVLIYPGVYEINGTTHPLIHLGDHDERISLVGVDRQSVIIKVTTTGSGIKITSGDETSRDCRIANLTIQTSNGHAIEIVKPQGAQTPKNITIEGVTIQASGTDKEGISGADATNVRVFDCAITTSDGNGMVIGDAWSIQNATVTAQGDNPCGLYMSAVDGVTIENSRVACDKEYGLSITNDSKNVTVRGCDIRGGYNGVHILLGDHILLDGCHIVADNSESGRSEIFALFYDRMSGGGAYDPTDIVAMGCRIEAVGSGEDEQVTYNTVAVQSDTDTFPRVVNCEIVAGAKRGAVRGVCGGGGMDLDPSVVVIGGSISTHCDDEKETEVWDVRRDDPGGGTGSVLVSGARLSKWRGPIKSAERPRSVVQRAIDVDAPDDDWIRVETDLPTSGEGDYQEVDPSHQPDVYRTLVVEGVEVGGSFSISGNVYVVGTNWGGDRIVESFDLDNLEHKDVGDKPFKTVTKIYLPIHANNVGKVKLGTTSKLGLYYPLSATGDVRQWGKKASAEDSYTIQDLTGQHGLNVDGIYATVEPKDGISADDSFEWAILASQ